MPLERLRPSWLFWTSLAAAVLAVKLAVLAVDAVPRVFLGDSGFYLYCALTGAIPYDRSFTYGRLIAVLGGPQHDVARLIAAQVVASAATALLLGAGLRVGFRASRGVVAVGTLLAAIEPLHLAYERFVMTESFAGLCYGVMVVAGLGYLSTRAPVLLVLVALVGVGLLSLRLNAVPVAWALPLALPLLARRRDPVPAPFARRWVHLGLSAVTVLAGHAVYRETYGHLQGHQAAYHDGGGHFMLAFVSPLVRPEDFPDGLASRILPEVKPPLRLARDTSFPLHVRDAHLWSPDGLVSAIKRQAGTFPASNALAGTVATRAVIRDPLGAIGLGVLTLRSYFDPTLRGVYDRHAVAAALRPDLGPPIVPPEEPLVRHGIGPRSMGPSLVRWWHLSAADYYPFILLCPLLALLGVGLADREGRPAALWVFLVSALMVVTGPLLAASTVIRYLHPLAWVNVLVVVAVAQAAFRRAEA